MEYLIASVVVFIAGLITFYLEVGMTRSISQIYFKTRWKSVFIIWQWIFAILLILAKPDTLIFLAATFICFSAAAANTKINETAEKVHIIGATGGIVLAMAWLIGIGLWPVVVLQAGASIFGMWKPVKNHTYWIEILAYILTVSGILYELI